MAVGEVHLSALDVGGGDLGGSFEGIARGNNERRVFARGEGADSIGNAENFRRREGDAAESLVGRQAVGGSGAGMVGKVTDIGGSEAAGARDAELNTRLV